MMQMRCTPGCCCHQFMPDKNYHRKTLSGSVTGNEGGGARYVMFEYGGMPR